MAYTPAMDQTNLQQSFYPQVIYGTNLLGTYTIGQFFLAAATNSVVYKPGVIMAQYTAGPSVGKIVNWKASAANGQGTAIGVLVDNYVNPADSAAPPTGTAVNVLRLGKVYATPLTVPAGDSLTAALIQLNAVAFTTPDMSTAYDLRGPVVS